MGLIRSLLPPRRLPLLVFLVLLLALGCVAFALRDRGVVFPGVGIAGHSAAGLSQPGVQDMARRLLPRVKVRLTLDPLSWEREPADLGLRFFPEQAARKAWLAGRTGTWPQRMARRFVLRLSPLNVPIPSSFDRRGCRSALSGIAGALPAKPRNATATLSSGRVKIVPEQPGGTLDIEACMNRIERWAAGRIEAPVELQGNFTRPRIVAADLKDVTSAIVTFSTSLGTSSASRRHNVRLAAEAISGTVLMPGEVFSFNQVVGPRTREAGYRTAPVLQHGLPTPGTGGGACQVSSTLYNAALLANLKIVKRFHHSRPVPYLAAGRDATVLYGVFDLRFRNSSGSPIVLHASVGRRRITFSVLGKPMETAVRLHSWRRSGKSAPPEVKIDAGLPPGERVVERSGKRAVMAVTVREVGESPGAVRETVSRDYYAPVPAVVRIGPPAPAQPKPAAPEPEGVGPPADGAAKPSAPRPWALPDSGDARPGNPAAGAHQHRAAQIFRQGALTVLTAFGDFRYNTRAAGA